MALFVLVHGGFAGGWCLQPSARHMRACGHEVYTPTLTGLGERVHLAHPDVDLDLHILDVVNVLEYEDLYEVVLVGGSYGGMVVTGVADRIPQRIAQVIYLDAFVPQDGQSTVDLDRARRGSEEDLYPIFDGWRVRLEPPVPRTDDQPLKTFTQPICLTNPAAALQLPRTYVRFIRTEPPIWPDAASKARAAGWRYRELDVDHEAVLTHPLEVADLLMSLI